MPILSIIRPAIPPSSKDHFLAAWPTLLAELQAQPGILHATAGEVVAEDGQKVDEFEIVQYLAFASVEDEEAFAKSAWAQEHKARLESSGAPHPTAGRFEFSDLAASSSPKPFLQLTSITLSSESQRDEVRAAWTNLITILGKETRGGKLLREDVFNGIAFLGWDSLEEVENAYKDPKASEALASYKSLGQVKSVLLKLL
ncbi:hypothetical protein BKA56DRAFT_632006 [Ilyonectria sp. MPI-CAGE-AT-0026]|nr:hypothetical protein BKA56DRAFT_632006 [Ilyonectria sp. MPI-CAGE-AT-0026]